MAVPPDSSEVCYETRPCRMLFLRKSEEENIVPGSLATSAIAPLTGSPGIEDERIP